MEQLSYCFCMFDYVPQSQIAFAWQLLTLKKVQLMDVDQSY
jgi:hypothetical protein